jgi:hypothetical protein
MGLTLWNKDMDVPLVSARSPCGLICALQISSPLALCRNVILSSFEGLRINPAKNLVFVSWRNLAISKGETYGC